MINPSKLFIWLCLAFTVSNSQRMHPFGGYQHEIAFPSIIGELHTSTISDRQPARQLSAGFHLNPPPPLPFLQSFPINPFLLSSARNMWRGESPQFGRALPQPLLNLFTPNTVRQRPESAAQDEEYRKYLKEEAEEAEKERNENYLTTNSRDFSLEATSAGPKPTTFVKVTMDGKDYSYQS